MSTRSTRVCAHLCVFLALLATSPSSASPGRPSVSRSNAKSSTSRPSRRDSAPRRERSRARWWKHFGDPRLDTLISRSLRGNYDLQAAANRIVQAEATALRNRSALFPTLTGRLHGTTAPSRTLGFQFGGFGGEDGATNPELYYTGDASLRFSYRVSAWGQDYLAYKGSRLQRLASQGDRESIAHALAVQIAEAYFDAVSATEQLSVLKAQVESNQKVAELTQLLYEKGDATALSVLQQKQQLASAKAALPPARSNLRVSLRQLQVLQGREPSRTPPSVASSLPALPRRPALGNRASLLKSRPDLRAQEARLRAATKQKKSARLVHVPDIDLSANLGYQLFRFGETSTQNYWDAGVTLSLPLFRGLGDINQVKEAKAHERTVELELESLVLQAIAEVENALVRERETKQELEAYEAQKRAADAAFEESKRSYIAGAASYLDLLNSLNSLQQVETRVLQAKRSLLGTRIALYQALGDRAEPDHEARNTTRIVGRPQRTRP